MKIPNAPAIWRLTLATAIWGLSFPTGKAVMEVQARLLPGLPEWFHAAFILFSRMLIATLVMLALLGRRMRGLTRAEVAQGLELGLFGGVGMLLQVDAQHYLAASASAFFTQFTCIFVPLVVAVRRRKAPPAVVMVACVLVMSGCVLLSGMEFGQLGFGRGEWETILAAVLFTGQILCLEQTRFFGNDMRRTATTMFAVKGAIMLPIVLGVGGISSLGLLAHGPMLALTLILALLCTVYSYGVMTLWQPRVSATQAGLIYATEPVFATIFAVFLPGWYSLYAGIAYANEHLSWQLFVGGGMMLLANLLLIFRPGQPAHGNAPAAA